MNDADGLPAGSGRARDLVGRRRQRPAPETGRVHHLGAAPAVMPVLGGTSEGSGAAAETATPAETASTRTAAVQLASRTRWELEQLLAALEVEMAAAASALDFEAAAQLRDEVVRVRAELDRRPAR
jgi:UvrB/UvrC motif-containing protein